jgi:aquaporin Z
MYENYAVQVSTRWLAELLGTYVVTFTYVLASVNQQMAAEHSAAGKAQRNATDPVFVHMPHVHRTPVGSEAVDTRSTSSVAWATGAAMLSLAYALGSVSGSHFNPAVTLAVLLSRRPGCPVAEGTSFMLAQGGAAIGAALTVCMLHRSGSSMFNKDRVVDMGPVTEDGYSWPALVIGEGVFTAAMALVLMCMVTVKSPRYPKAPSTKSFQFALVTGMCYTAGSYAMEGISHGHLNPAVSLGVAASNFISSGFQTVNSQALLYYVAAQALGSVAAAIVFVVVHPHEYKMDPLLAGQQLAADGARQGLERRPLAARAR